MSTMFDYGDESRYIQTSLMIKASKRLELPSIPAAIRVISQYESMKLAEVIKKRKAFSRHSWENDFYVQRISNLGGKTIIEIFRQGEPDEIIEYARNLADIIEKLIILSVIFSTTRYKLHRLMAISNLHGETFDITIGPKFKYLRSKAKPQPQIKGIELNDRIIKRFTLLGFVNLITFSVSRHGNSKRVKNAINWIYESRLEPNISAAIVKSAIALESLLGLDSSEPLSRTISERSAYLLSSLPGIRENLNKAIKRFYDTRSAVVHGGRKKLKNVNYQIIEGIDRLILLLCVVFSANSEPWRSIDKVVSWCELEKWGKSDTEILRPFPKRYLSDAIKLALKQSGRTSA